MGLGSSALAGAFTHRAIVSTFSSGVNAVRLHLSCQITLNFFSRVSRGENLASCLVNTFYWLRSVVSGLSDIDITSAYHLVNKKVLTEAELYGKVCLYFISIRDIWIRESSLAF